MNNLYLKQSEGFFKAHTSTQTTKVPPPPPLGRLSGKTMMLLSYVGNHCRLLYNYVANMFGYTPTGRQQRDILTFVSYYGFREILTQGQLRKGWAVAFI